MNVKRAGDDKKWIQKNCWCVGLFVGIGAIDIYWSKLSFLKEDIKKKTKKLKKKKIFLEKEKTAR